MESHFEHLDKVAVVTGGAQGIGRETCLVLAREGAHVVCGDIDENYGRDLEEEFKKTSKGKGSISFVKCDAGKGEDCKALVDFAIKNHKKIDILFNNVGIQPKESNVPIHLLDEAVWDKVFDVNIKSVFWMCKYTIPHMLNAKCGSIINNASIQGVNSQKGVPAYGATKGAMLSLTRQLAVEYGQYNIRVNAVSPGTILTPLARANNPSMDYVASNTPMGHVGEPSDVANLVSFLAGEKSKWITGQNFLVDGGITVKGGWSPLNL